MTGPPRATDGSSWQRRTNHGRSSVVVALILVALVCVYLATVLPNLGDNPIVGGDEGWIISASAKLAEDGVFGSDLFRGFHGVEDHYFFNLPLHHLVVAGAFKTLGVGVTQARLVSVVYGLATLMLTYALGRRVGGVAVGAGAAALLVFLRLNLAPFSGLSLTDLGATVRYDLIAVPYGLGAAMLLLRRPEPTVLGTALAGVLVGLATLTQFLGAFFIAPFVLFLMTLSLPLARRLLLAGLLVAITALVCLPYGVYVLAHHDAFEGQTRAIDQETDFLSPSFYVEQLRRERDRYAISTALENAPASLGDLASRPSARLTMFFVGPLALACCVSLTRRSPAHRLTALTIMGLVLQLALFESTKRFVYWVPVVPFLCIAIADAAAWVLAPRERDSVLPMLAKAAAVLVLAIFAVEGVSVAAKDVLDARDAPSYAEAGGGIDAAMPPGASAMGDNRLWPALRHRDYRSLLLLFYYTNPATVGDEATDVFGALDRIGSDYLLLSPLSREILRNLTPEGEAEFERYLSERGALETTVDAPGYGPVEVWRLRHGR